MAVLVQSLQTMAANHRSGGESSMLVTTLLTVDFPLVLGNRCSTGVLQRMGFV